VLVVDRTGPRSRASSVIDSSPVRLCLAARNDRRHDATGRNRATIVNNHLGLVCDNSNSQRGVQQLTVQGIRILNMQLRDEASLCRFLNNPRLAEQTCKKNMYMYHAPTHVHSFCLVDLQASSILDAWRRPRQPDCTFGRVNCQQTGLHKKFQ
jgi:hypothetical protein